MGKDRRTNKDRYFKNNLQLLNEFHLGMFEYTGFPDTLRTNYLEYWLQKYGRVAIFKIPAGRGSDGFPEGSLICATCTQGTELDPYGEGSEIIAVTRNGFSVTLDRYSEDVVLAFNNHTELGNPDTYMDALRLAEIDISIDHLIFWTRLFNIFKVADENTKRTIAEAFSNIEAGKPITVVSKKIFEDLGIGTEDVTSEMLTSPEFAEKIQYTARLREDVLRWHYTRYGQVVQGDTKMAQQSVDEVNGTVSSSLIIPLNMLQCRKAMIDEINAKFGLSATVELAGAWRAEVTKYEMESGEADIDDTEEPAEDPEDPAAEPEPEERKEGEDDGNNNE